ncbi:cellulose synthase operon protein YhjQ/BcsQ [Paeniroseomonas aquatica]|uniref:Cellulose synthase operon protein YhjQ/BcsQ n=1 Tax=Paeniroseomonas aquatica TaxID=373043 RepID=A0ABT8AGC9_9PROT|nr:cellulose synthase operon protein YhjQ/BcsQ [Paeniroseomonas aquatica]MDN3568516.1 cellulose synthase operon protein YhjQ/BcsQ [Paeniroseomonas aquatica]
MPLICLASPKGGVGKTTLAANVADALRRRGRRVLSIDFDPQNTLRLHYGVALADGGGFVAGLPMRRDWRQLARPTAAGVALLPHGAIDLRGALGLAAALDRDPELLAAPMREILADPGLLVVADTAPGASQALSLLAPMAAMVVCVLLADATSAALLPEIDSGRFLGTGTLGALLDSRVRVVLNQVDPYSRLSRSAAETVARYLGPRLLGAVCRDEAVAEALASQRMLLDLAPHSRAAEDLREVAGSIEAALPPLPEAVPAAAGPLAWAAR